MGGIGSEIRKLLETYGGDTKQALKENPSLEYLYALSEIRENILEWYEFDPEASLLQVGADYGALTGLYSRRVRSVTVLEEDGEELETVRFRYRDRDNLRYERGTILEADWDGRFDYIVFAGSLGRRKAEEIKKAKSLLKPSGRLILAVCNKYGLKYWAGAKADEVSVSKPELLGLLAGGEAGGRLEFYYPMPDYRLPVSIYSEERLPALGELTNTVIAYDYPRYLKFNVGEKFDEVCGDGQFEYFANSFLTIWSRYEED